MLFSATLLLPWTAAKAAEPPKPRPIAANLAPRAVTPRLAPRIQAGRMVRLPVGRASAAPAYRFTNGRTSRVVDAPISQILDAMDRAPSGYRSVIRIADNSPASSNNATAPASRGTHPATPQPNAAGPINRRSRSQTAGAPPLLRDAPQELLPASESLAQARQALPQSPRAACLAAARRAEEVHELPPGLLVAVAMSESGLHAHAISLGGRSYHPLELEQARQILARAPKNASPMVGCVQVNARVHARGSDWPLDPLRSADWAGGMLQRWHQETGDWVQALRRWHGGSARTEHAVLCRVRAKLEIANPENDLLRGYACSESQVARARNQGRSILEIAESPE